MQIKILPPAEWEVKRAEKSDRPGPKDTPLEHRKSNAEALVRLIEHFDNNRTSLALQLGISVSNIFQWIRLKRVSKPGALLIDGFKNIPFTKEELRTDITDWRQIEAKAQAKAKTETVSQIEIADI